MPIIVVAFFSCKKCDNLENPYVDFYLDFIPQKRVYKINDTILLKIYIPFKTTDTRTNKAINVSTATIHQNSQIHGFEVIHRDSISKNNNRFPFALEFFKHKMILGKMTERTYLGFPISPYIDLLKNDTSFIAIVQLIPQKKGVFCFGHDQTIGKLGSCIFLDFPAKNKNGITNKDLYFSTFQEPNAVLQDSYYTFKVE